MKNVFILLCLLVFTIQMQAQKWAAPGATWLVGQDNPFSPPNFAGSLYNIDTTVSGIPCVYTSGCSATSYLSNDTVFFYIDNRFWPGLYFSAHQGDTLSFHYVNPCRPQDSTVLAVVDTVYYQQYDNDSLKTFIIDVISPDTIFAIYGKRFYYAEKIGFANSSTFYGGFGVYPPFLCFNPSSTDISRQYTCNYGDSSITNFWLINHSDCITTGIAGLSNNLSVKLSPNPVSDYLHITSSSAQYELKIYDILGKLAIEKNADQDVDVSQLSSGVYLLVLKDGEKVGVRRFIKE